MENFKRYLKETTVIFPIIYGIFTWLSYALAFSQLQEIINYTILIITFVIGVILLLIKLKNANFQNSLKLFISSIGFYIFTLIFARPILLTCNGGLCGLEFAFEFGLFYMIPMIILNFIYLILVSIIIIYKKYNYNK